MNHIKNKASRLLLAATGILLASSAYAGKPAPVTPSWTVETSAVTINNGIGSITLGGHAFTFTDSAAAPVQLAFYDSNPGSNSQASIETFIKSSDIFGLSSNKTLSFGGSNDSINAATTISAPAVPYDYLAVHVGNGELLFHWTDKVTTAFSINANNLSNYRAFASAVPEPSSYAMLLGGLAMLGLMFKKRKQT